MMIRSIAIVSMSVLACRANAQESAAPASAPPATGTPTQATATASPSTVAQAVTRDDTDAQGPNFDLSLGTSISSGSFGADQHSQILSTALGARYAIGAFRVSASLPYLDIRSRGIIFSGIDSTPVIAGKGAAGPRVQHDGIGDLTLGGAYTFAARDAVPEIELSGRVKLPTASGSSGLSTGKTDFSFGAQFTETFGSFAPFAAVSYRVFGDPSFVHLENGFAASTGASVGLGHQAVALFSYHYAAAATHLVRDSHELFAGVSKQLARVRLRFTGFVTAGLSSGAAARSGGISLAYAF